MPQLHANLLHLPASALGTVVAIGNFDGVHQGHAALLRQAAAKAAEAGVPLSVLTFEPHPREFFAPDASPFRLTLMPAKRRLLGDLGVTHVLAPVFDAELAATTADDFIEHLLVAALRARHIVVGTDFSFGHKRAGTAATLQAAADTGRFGLTLVPPVPCADGQPFSSSRIREHVKAAAFAAAAALLGRPWDMEGEVVHGDKRGRVLGYPTANQKLPRYVQIPHGVYAVRVQVEGETAWRDGVANFGIRPMFKVTEPVFETFIFDFDHEIYGKILRVQPVKYLRAEQNFAGLAALQAQMKQDCLDAKAVLKSA